MLRSVSDIKQTGEPAKASRTVSGRSNAPSAKSRRRQQFPAESFLQEGDGTEVRDGVPLDDAQDGRVRDARKTPHLTESQLLLIYGSDKSVGEQSGVLSGDVRGEVSSEPLDAFSGDLSGSDCLPLRHGPTVDHPARSTAVPWHLVGAPADLVLTFRQGSCQTPGSRVYSGGLYIDHSINPEADAMAITKPVQGVLLIEAVELVLKHWKDTDALTEASYKKFDDLLHRYAKFAQAHNVPVYADQTEALAAKWIKAKGTSRHGVVSEPALATQNTRRSALRKFYRDAEELRIHGSGLVVRTRIAPRTPGFARPLTEEEAQSVWLYAKDSGPRTRRPVMFALLLSGVHSSEVGLITVSDVDTEKQRVWAHGDTVRVEPRWVNLKGEYFSAVVDRIEYLRGWIPSHITFETFQLTQGNSTRPLGQSQNRAASSCAEVFRMAGLHKDARITPSSVSLYAGSRMLIDGERIEVIAHALGYKSIDSCIKALGYDWQTGVIG
jgi:integrase